MQENAGAAACGGERSGAKGLRLFINPAKLRLDDRTVIFRYTGDGGWVCLAFGDGAKFMRAAAADPMLRKRIADRAARLISERRASDPDLARVVAAVALSKDYNPNEPRDAHGRWTSDGAAGAEGDSHSGGGGAAAAGVAAASAAGRASAFADAFNVYGNDGVLPALRTLASRALGLLPAILPEGAAATAVATGGSAVVLGTLFLPLNRAAVSEGTLPNAPEFAYQYDHDTGRLTVTRRNDDGTTETVFTGHHDTSGVFRDEDGNAIGRYLGGSVALDADAVRGYEARRSDAKSRPGAAAQTSTAAGRSKPKLCPAPGPDKAGFKSPGAIAYQMYVGQHVNGEPLPLGLGIKMMRPNGWPVYFDDCQRSTGALIEAKGLGYSKAMNSGRLFPWLGMYFNMMKQAKRQLESAHGRPIIWYFAEKDVGDRMRSEFAKKRLPITVVNLPPPRGLIGQLKRIAEGGWHGLSDFIGMLSER